MKEAPVRQNTLEKGIAGKPSTKAETEVWKQTEGNADKSTGKPAVREEREEGKGRNRG